MFTIMINIGLGCGERMGLIYINDRIRPLNNKENSRLCWCFSQLDSYWTGIRGYQFIKKHCFFAVWFCPVVSEPVEPYFTRFLRVLTFCLGASNGVVFYGNGVVKWPWEVGNHLSWWYYAQHDAGHNKRGIF